MATAHGLRDRLQWAMVAPAIALTAAFGFVIHEVKAAGSGQGFSGGVQNFGNPGFGASGGGFGQVRPPNGGFAVGGTNGS